MVTSVGELGHRDVAGVDVRAETDEAGQMPPATPVERGIHRDLDDQRRVGQRHRRG
jgi:hypothetical protein